MNENHRKLGVAAFDHALAKAGSYKKLAEICGCTKQNLHNARLLNRPISARYVEAVEAETGVSRYDLRPDIYSYRQSEEVR